MRLNALGRTLLALGLAAVLFISLNTLAGRFLGGDDLDLTAEQLYSLSPATRHVLADLPEPVALRLYFSERLGQLAPPYAVYEQRIRSLLETYVRSAHGKLSLEILDPTPYSETEDRATAAGLQSISIEEGGDPLYLGLIGCNTTDDVQSVPFFQPDRERFLEYDITRVVQSLAFPKKRVLGLVSPLPLEGDPTGIMQSADSKPEALIDQLRQTFRIRDMTLDFDKVPADTDVMMIVQPSKLAPKTLYAIDQWVLAGGRALVLADPWSEIGRRQANRGGVPWDVTLYEFGTLLHSWGADIPQGHFIADRGSARDVNASEDPATPRVVPYAAWLQLHNESLERSDPVTGKLERLNLATAGEINPVPGASTRFEPLLQTTEAAGAISIGGLQSTVADIDMVTRSLEPTGKRYTLAARLTGPATTAFPDGPPSGAATGPAEIMKSVQPIDVIVVADSDIIDNPVWAQFKTEGGRTTITPMAQNLEFIQNALEDLLGSADLIGLRSRGSAFRPFSLVDDLRKRAQDQFQLRETQLQDRLKTLQEKLGEARTGQTGQLSPQQAADMEQLRTEIIGTRGDLRQVRLSLRQDIDKLKLRLVAFNTVLVPLLVAGAAIALSVLRLRRRRRRSAAH